MIDRRLGEKLRNLPKDELTQLLSRLTEEEAESILYNWREVWARDSQLIEDHWPETIALVMAGRGLI